MNETKPIIKITQAAFEIGVSQKTLRLWDDLNILVADRVGKGIGQRLYSVHHIELGKKIAGLTSIGVGIAGIKILLNELNLSGWKGNKLVSKLEYIIENYKTEHQPKKKGRGKHARK